ncbi:phosphoribosylanthranilate isomerase [Hyphococcus luteus]|uniref:N-(5'-phosphoribosyl)anthranilate isomerase n=1 Tax=Hyphococcus luteus TaxID=2058213 RepID=A0A2S7K6D0_9PROT|nr:phosphoribosylanthranilate isomerase [Marinicaulis flavus]PQA88075.1 phosphoribosylanthranilate isomerase [Marinicaulis flavus]
MSGPLVKICGVKDAATAIDAARAGADFLGFVFFRKSPRFVTPEAAEEIILDLKQAAFDEGFAMPRLVGLFVDAGEKELSEAAPLLTHFQFHGHESPERCSELGLEFGVEVIKAIPVTGKGDVSDASDYEEAADIILFDAKPPPGAGQPGGNGVSFDWTLLSAYEGETPYIVAGGLTPENVGEAVKGQKSREAFLGVDVSSGVESAPGKKDDALVKAFISASKG